jgi:hypothetical protein
MAGLLEDNLKNTQEYIQASAVKAYQAFGQRFFSSPDLENWEYGRSLVPS